MRLKVMINPEPEEGRDSPMKNLAYLMFAMLLGCLMSLGIWVGAISALFQHRKERKVLSAALPRAA